MKKLTAILLTLVLLLTMTTAVFAEGTELGSITINGVSDSTTYEIY